MIVHNHTQYQTTHFRDRNGQEVQVGDIVCDHYPDHKEDNCSGLPRTPNMFHRVIKYDGKKALFTFHRDPITQNPYPCTIIGKAEQNNNLL